MAQVRSLPEYRKLLEDVREGTIPAYLALEILAAAEAEIERAQGEFTIAQAVERSGRSRSWFERRLARWAEQGLARKPGVEWLVKAAAIPPRSVVHPHGFDPALPDAAILGALAADDRAA